MDEGQQNAVICEKIDDKVFNFLNEQKMKILWQKNNQWLMAQNDKIWEVSKYREYDMRSHNFINLCIDSRLSGSDVEKFIIPHTNVKSKVEFF